MVEFLSKYIELSVCVNITQFPNNRKIVYKPVYKRKSIDILIQFMYRSVIAIQQLLCISVPGETGIVDTSTNEGNGLLKVYPLTMAPAPVMGLSTLSVMATHSHWLRIRTYFQHESQDIQHSFCESS